MNHLLISLWLSLFHWAGSPVRQQPISDSNYMASTPRLTTDHRGAPVLSWIEKAGEQGYFYFAVSADGGRTFGEKKRIGAPTNLSTHAEGAPKLAFKKDGTVMALFEITRPTSDSPYAGDLLFVTSTDGGQTWSAPKPVHRDSSPGKSHSFGDLTRLPNGEIGLVWLDDKAPGKSGRTVRFTQTRSDGGFGEEIIVDDNACQCCRTNVFVDDRQQIHLTYRDWLDDGSRDMGHVVSTDGGRTFSPPTTVYTDHWQVNACPHTGPALAQSGGDVYATWFSGKEGCSGLRLIKLGSAQLTSSVPTNRAKHPQLVNSAGRLVWLWDESMEKNGTYFRRIGMRTFSGNDVQTTYLTPEGLTASYPVAVALKNGLIVAYEQQKEGQNSVIVCQWIDSLQ